VGEAVGSGVLEGRGVTVGDTVAVADGKPWTLISVGAAVEGMMPALEHASRTVEMTVMKPMDAAARKNSLRLRGFTFIVCFIPDTFSMWFGPLLL
jgi:hypothetical protein